MAQYAGGSVKINLLLLPRPTGTAGYVSEDLNDNEKGGVGWICYIASYCETLYHESQRRSSGSEWLRNSCLEGGIGIIPDRMNRPINEPPND